MKGKGNSMSEKAKAKELLLFQVHKGNVFLWKALINVLEDQRQYHKLFLEKLEENLTPEQYEIVKKADYFNDSYFGYFRKKILDIGNDSLREFEDQINLYKVDFDYGTSLDKKEDTDEA